MCCGRTFTSFDGPEGPGVVIVNESFARQYLPDREAVGALIRVSTRSAESTTMSFRFALPMSTIANRPLSPWEGECRGKFG